MKFVLNDLFYVEFAYVKKISYLNVIDNLIYAMIGTIPDIVYAISFVSRFMNSPCKEQQNGC